MYNTKALRSRLSNLETNNIDIMTNEYIKVYQCFTMSISSTSRSICIPIVGNIALSKSNLN